MQGNSTFSVPLGSTHFGATKSTRRLDSDSLGASLHRILHGPFHSPSECHSTNELVGDALSDQCSVKFWLLDLNDVQFDLGIPGQLCETLSKPISFGAFTSDNDSRTCCMYVDLQLLAGSLNLDTADGSVRELFHQERSNIRILD